MPAIIRGTRTRRQAEEDIEEQEPTQRSRTEDVEDADEEQPRRSSKRSSTRGADDRSVKKEKKPKATRERKPSIAVEQKPAQDGEDEGEAEDARPGIDVENFQDQPLQTRDGLQIKAMKTEWIGILSSFRGAAIELGPDVGEAMAEVGMGRDGEAARKELDNVDTMMRDLLSTQAEIKAHIDTLDNISSSIAAGEEIDNVIARYEQGVLDLMEAWDNKTNRQKFGKDEDYTKFRQKIFEVQNGPDEAMPPMTEFIPQEDGDDSDEDDIVVGGVSQVYTCPITLTPLVEPMTSQICKHTFSKTSIYDYFKNNRSTRKKCPATGCNQQFTLMDLKADKDIEKAVKAHLRRQKQREAEADSENDDAEEIID